MFDVKAVQRFASQMSWAAGLSPWMRDFSGAAGGSTHTRRNGTRPNLHPRILGQLWFVMTISQLEATVCVLAGQLQTPVKKG